MNKRVILLIKIVIFVGVIGSVAYAVHKAWVAAAKVSLSLTSIDWRYAILAVLGFIGVMLVSGLTWRWLAGKMGDRTPVARAVGAYTFSQMGKYIPGKVALLLMRIDRAKRFGMTPGVCTLSTLLENALYMISGGLVGMVAISHIAGALTDEYRLIRTAIWPMTIAAIILLVAVCHPKIFYRLVDALLKRMKKPPVAPENRLREGILVLGVLGFVPCWVCGGFALWASTCSLHPIPIESSLWFIGAFSLSVIVGMVSFLPGGTGIREVVLGIAVALQLSTVMDHNRAVLIGAMVAVVQRICQIIAELLVGLAGALMTSKRTDVSEPV